MGIALFTLPVFRNPLRDLMRRLSLQVPTGVAPTGHRPTTASAILDRPQWSNEAGLSSRSGEDSRISPSPQRPADAQGTRPMRGNWPFTVKPPVRSPEAPIRPPAAASRSFLSIPSMGSNRHTFLASLTADASTHQTTRVLRRKSDSGTGRLVIAGRMADVCAELDRIAASEAIQA
ncbi:hypothetical protein [Acidovorax sp. 69]|uniref:hypothetical protein n=1 Tax=Acidovorax sp. 69 TaxID=2035202 RepID=UPI0012FD32AD|nr:hypothetical protein [Acidovorax sp. 69]